MGLDGDTARLLARLAEMGGGADRDMSAIDAPAARLVSATMWELFRGDAGPDCPVEPLAIPGPAAGIPARLYRPPGRAADALLPLVVFLHGGGWAMGDLDAYEPLVMDLCVGSGAAFLAVDYRLAPEHPFPAGLKDSLAAIEWAAEQAPALGIDAARIAVMGDSAGGNLATVAARRLHEAGTHRLVAQFLLYPVLDVASPHDAYPSRLAHGDGDYLLARTDLDATTAWYTAAGADPADPDISPLRAPDLSTLPPTVILVGGHDPLLDEARRYAERLAAAGVACEFRCCESAIHAFLSFGDLAVARRGRTWLAGKVAHYLRGGPPRPKWRNAASARRQR
ncbi:MAG: alpha/beta hydrolase [Rhodothalassiaceae bacterium]